MNLLSELPFFNESEIEEYKAINISHILPDFKNICFNPLILNTISDNKEYCNDDTSNETEHWMNIASHQSKYFDQHTFHNAIQEKITSNSCHFSTFHINSRSLKCHYTELLQFLDSLNFNFTVIGVSESWLDSTNEQMHTIPGYKAYHLSRDKQKGGGISLYIHDNVNSCKLREDLTSNDGEYESLFVELTLNSSTIIIGLIYRPPGKNMDIFNNSMTDILNMIQPGRNKCVIMGDLNIDLLKVSDHYATKSYYELMQSHYLFPKITKPTRVNQHSASLIDHIFTNFHDNDVLSGIF